MRSVQSVRRVQRAANGNGSPSPVPTHAPENQPQPTWRIILRDGCACVLCHTREDLVIGHAVSVRDGYADGLTNKLLYSDNNLVAICTECNSGQGGDSIPPHRLLLILSLRAQRRPASGASPKEQA